MCRQLILRQEVETVLTIPHVNLEEIWREGDTRSPQTGLLPCLGSLQEQTGVKIRISSTNDGAGRPAQARPQIALSLNC